MLPGAGWYMIFVFVLLIYFCKEVRACLKLFCCVGKIGPVISVLEVYSGSLGHFCFCLATTQAEKSPIAPVVIFNSTRNTVMGKNRYSI